MSEFDRAFRIGRAYANNAREAIFGGQSAEEKAVQELDAALEHGVAIQKSEQQADNEQIELMSQDEAEIILGVPNKASFGQIKAQYDLLISHVVEFEANAPTKKSIAQRERRRIEKAFQLLSANADSTEKRFGSLEID